MFNCKKKHSKHYVNNHLVTKNAKFCKSVYLKKTAYNCVYGSLFSWMQGAELNSCIYLDKFVGLVFGIF